MVLRAGYAALALQLQEAMDSGDALSANDIRSRLSDAINDAHRGTGKWAYYIDHFGDGESGDVIYCCDGDTCRASYEISDTAGAAKCVIDIEHAEDVIPRTVYEPEADEAEHYATMETALKAETLYTGLPVYERFISKAERDKASADDFAGKGKSFPILKPEDVKAAAASIGRAGPGNMGPSGIKARIIAIAKRKGWTSQLPKSWQSDSETKEAAPPAAGTGTLRLVESSAAWLAEIPLREASGLRTNYPIRIINPGTGSTAHYSADVLKREAAKFRPGTLMFWNHPTPVEEAARPEGDLNNLAAITTSQGVWKDDGPKGPGIYAEAKVMADYAEKVAERAPHIGLSIRAGGERDGSKMVEGKPVLKEFSYIESVDYVTKAGRGGLALAEAARDAGVLEIPTQEAGMTADETKKLIEAAVAPYQQRLLRSDAREEATRLLEGVALPAAAKTKIIERATTTVPTTAEGAIDLAKFREMVVAEAKAEGEYLAAISPQGRVTGFGAPGPMLVPPKPEEIAAREAQEKADFEAYVKIYERQGMSRKAAEFAARGREEDVA